MLKSLGQSPSPEELDAMMKDAEGGQIGDGRIDMREFLKWYAKICNQARDLENEDIMDAYKAVGSGETITKEEIQKKLMEDFGLDVDVADLFNCSGSLKFEAFKSLMLSKAA